MTVAQEDALYDYLDGARNPDGASLDELIPVFAQVGRMHAEGLVQEDAHLGNFLLKDERLHVIDGDAIRSSAAPADCAANLALLLAQLQKQLEQETLSLVIEVVKKVLGRNLKGKERIDLTKNAVSEITKQIQ